MRNLTGNIKDKWSLFSPLGCCSSEERAEWVETHCNAIQTECLFNRHYKDVIRREPTRMFVRMPVDNCMFTSQSTLPPGLSAATCSEHSHNFHLTTGLNCVCLLRKRKDISAEGTYGHTFIYGRRVWEINPCCAYSWLFFHTEAFQNKTKSSWSFTDRCKCREESVCPIRLCS